GGNANGNNGGNGGNGNSASAGNDVATTTTAAAGGTAETTTAAGAATSSTDTAGGKKDNQNNQFGGFGQGGRRRFGQRRHRYQNRPDIRTLGRLIYTRDGYSIYEVDGEEHQLFSQNLSLFAKLFLDNKSVFFDVASFDYYLLVQDVPAINPARPESRITGFFSKEKISWDNNNLACILVFPPWQRKGFGKILMGISYQLSKLEGRVGGPEKPLSELGRVGYARFWEARLAAAILKLRSKATVSLQEVSDRCWMLPEDVITTLNDMAIVNSKPRSDGSVAVSKAKVRDWVLSNNVDLTPPIDEEYFAAEYVAEFDAG
ncbi:MAG: hypothetical protein Q9214_003219, partial [Letrouitia sp. 1 TL-2023]